MSNPSILLLRTTISLFVAALLFPMDGVAAGGEQHHHHRFGWAPVPITGGGCEGGSVGECSEADSGGVDVFGMESEISRRILATSQYISYGALEKDRVPCSRRGASYYNCKPGAQANPYSRGCTSITRCRS